MPHGKVEKAVSTAAATPTPTFGVVLDRILDPGAGKRARPPGKVLILDRSSVGRAVGKSLVCANGGIHPFSSGAAISVRYSHFLLQPLLDLRQLLLPVRSKAAAAEGVVEQVECFQQVSNPRHTLLQAGPFVFGFRRGQSGARDGEGLFETLLRVDIEHPEITS